MVNKIKLFDPKIGKEEELTVKRIMKSGFWASGAGIENVKKFETMFSKYTKTKNSVAVNSGTAALNLALSVFDIKNKEVILPSLSFISTAHAIILNGGIPVFVDVDPKTLCIDPIQIKKSISKKSIMILPVHFAGMPANMQQIKEIATENKLHLIEDAAHAVGSTYNHKKIGSHGDLVCFSFHPVKNLAMPTGGIVTINAKNSKKITKDLKEKRWCGITNRKDTDYDVKQIGWNYYMNEFSAAIGLEQLKKLDELNKQRRKTTRRYFNEISLEDKMPFDNNCSYHFYWIRVKNRKKFREQLLKKGIETGIHYKPIHTFSFYKSKNYLPITENISKEIVSLPTHPNLTESNIDHIIKIVNKFLN